MPLNDYTVHNVWGHRVPDALEYSEDTAYPCRVGVELELEGIGLGHVHDRDAHPVWASWKFMEDGSLRGHSFEAVLNQPLASANLLSSLADMNDFLSHWKQKFKQTGRASTHIHVDVRDLTLEQVRKFIIIYLVYENTLFRVAGDDRMNNNYCMPLAGCVELLLGLGGNAIDDAIRALGSVERYSALNLQALPKFGSLEFRHYPSAWDMSKVLEWINLLLCLKRWAVESTPDIRDIPQYLSGMGAQALTDEVFGEYITPFKYKELESDCYDGIRIAQNIIYQADAEELSRNAINFIKKLENV